MNKGGSQTNGLKNKKTYDDVKSLTSEEQLRQILYQEKKQEEDNPALRIAKMQKLLRRIYKKKKKIIKTVQ